MLTVRLNAATSRGLLTPFEYVLPLVSVLVGLALADLAVSLHRLLRARSRVRWDWLPLSAAILAAISALQIWWTFYGSQTDTFYQTLGGFLPLAAQLVVLFLINAAALPDQVPEDGLDLREFYDVNAPYFWSLYAVLFVLFIAQRVGAYAVGYLSGEVGAVASWVATSLIPVALFIALARVRRRAFHAVAVIAVLLLLSTEWAGLRLGAT